VTGDWANCAPLHNCGIYFNLDYYSEMAGNVFWSTDNSRGFQKRVLAIALSYADQFLLGLGLDFQKLVGWDGGSFRALFLRS